MYKSLLLGLILTFAIVLPIHATVIQVPADYSTIQEAIDDSNDGDIIIVSPGTYNENINFLGKQIILTSTDPNDRDVIASTIIEGDQTTSVVTFNHGETNATVLKGFTITNGFGTLLPDFSINVLWGCGILCHDSSPIISDNLLTGNHGSVNSSIGFIGYGGAVGCVNSNAIVTRNIIENNESYVGGGVVTYHSNAIISNNIIKNNSAVIGGGVVLLGGTLVNNTIVDNMLVNSGSQGGNVYASNETGALESRIYNNIIADCNSGYGFYANGVWDNSLVKYNNMWNNLPANYSGISDFTGFNGNISSDPLLTDDYHINTTSPCYNAGDPGYIPYLGQRDIDGEYAVMGNRVEIGADEISGNAKPIADAGTSMRYAASVSNVTLDGNNSYDPDNSGIFTYSWIQISGPEVVLNNADTAEPDFVPVSIDIYVFELTVYDGEIYSYPDTVTIRVGNHTPVSNAGPDILCRVDHLVTLNGSDSNDPDMSDTITYSWAQISGPLVELSDPNAASPTFIADNVGEYVFALVVSDGIESSQGDMVIVTCKAGSEPDAYGYSWIDSDDPWGPAFDWIDIKDTGIRVQEELDYALQECFGPYQLGFDFNFYGNTYDYFYIQIDGAISFNSTPIPYYSNNIPQQDGYDNMIAWMWGLWYPLLDSDIYYQQFDGYTVIQFVNFTAYFDNNAIVNAEVIIYESGRIKVQYKDVIDEEDIEEFTIGIENSDGTIGTLVSRYQSNYVHDGLVVEFSTDGPYEPVANAGPEQHYKHPELITLDGTGSKDRDFGDVLTYHWTQTSGPVAELSDPNSVMPTFMPTEYGIYTFKLVVNDGTYDSVPNEVEIIIGNRAPIAEAGIDQVCEPGNEIVLDGSESYDLDGDVLTYAWVQVSGPEAELEDVNTITPHFIPAYPGRYVFELVVSDGNDFSSPDTVNVLCKYGSLPDAYGYSWIDSDDPWGPAFDWIDIKDTGIRVQEELDYALEECFGPYQLGFDFNFYGNTYDYFYIQIDGAISFDSTPFPYNNNHIPEQDGYDNMIAWLWGLWYPLLDSDIYYQHFDGYTVIQFINFTAYFDNDAIVNAEVIIYESGRIKVQYKDVIDEEDIHEFTIGIENADGTIGTMVAYDPTNYVHDGLVVEFSTGGPYEPVAHAGPEQQFKTLELVTLDGTDSRDRDFYDVLTYHWTQTSGPAVVLSDPNSAMPTFMPTEYGTYTFELVVNDGTSDSVPNEVVIIIGNRAPIADAGIEQVCEPGDEVTLDGSESYDLDFNDVLTYSWVQVSGPETELEDANTAAPYFTPTYPGNYVFSLVVNDGNDSSTPDTVTILCKYGSLPDAYGYEWIDSDCAYGPSFHWIDIEGCRNYIDDFEDRPGQNLGPIYLDFEFPFYGKKFGKLYVQSSGVLTFGSDTFTTSGQRIPNADGYNNMIAWLWTYMSPLTDSIVYYKSFTDYMVIQFNNFTLSEELINAQVILYKSGKIVIQYKNFTNGSNRRSSYTIGIENSTGTIGSEVAHNDRNYLHDELAIEFRIAGGPYEPVARAGADQQYKSLQEITLDGSGSNDRDPEDVLTYQWTQTGGPTVELGDTTNPVVTFMPETPGEYVFQLVVNDGTYSSLYDEVVVYIGNHVPVADAGKDIVCEPNKTTTFNGSKSYDDDVADTLTYNWTQVSGPAQVDIQYPNQYNARIFPLVRGEYVFQLVVSDGYVESEPDTVNVKCDVGTAPDQYGYRCITNTGSKGPKFNWIDIKDTGIEIPINPYVMEGAYGSFPMGFDFNFYGHVYSRFYVQACGVINFSPNTIYYYNRSIPDDDGYDNLIALLWAPMYPQEDSKIFYQNFDDYTVIQYVDYHHDYGGKFNAEAILYKNGKIVFQYKDFSSDYYRYQHTVGIENSNGTIATVASYNNSSFIRNELVVEFTTEPFLPIADAGEDQYLSRPTQVTLDGSNSNTYDPSGITAYHWNQVSGPQVTLSDANSMNPTFMPAAEASYVFELIVNDISYPSVSDQVEIIVHDRSPVAEAGENRKYEEIPASISLDGTGSYDPLMDTLYYHWTQIEGPSVELSDSNLCEPSFVPSEFGYYQFELVVTDGYISSIPDVVTIVLDDGFFPVADAGLPVYTDGRDVRLNGTLSYDPDNQPGELMYFWEQISGPTAIITDANTDSPLIGGVVQNNTIQICEFQLVVFDGEYFSFPDTVQLRVIPKPANSTLVLVNGPFDPAKPTIVFFDGGDCVTSNSYWWFSDAWTDKANAFCFNYYEPDKSSNPQRYYHCGDMLIFYLSRVAPNYDQPIQTIGFSTGAQPAIDVALRMNLIYSDARYAINRITLFDSYCRDYEKDIINYTSCPVDGEQNWIDMYCSTPEMFYPGTMCTQVSDGDMGAPPHWYNDSISNPLKNQYNGGLVAGGYWSVIGPGKNFQLSRDNVHSNIYRYIWDGSIYSGYLDYYNPSSYPGKMLGLVTLLEPYDGGDPNGAVLSCMECENAVGYELLIGTDPKRVMDFEVVYDSQNPPDCIVTSLPAEQCWWTVRARDQFGSTIYADPIPVNEFMLSLPVQNVTTGIRYATIQNAVDNAASGDEIQLGTGVYYENVICPEKNIIIRSTNPQDPNVVSETIIIGGMDGIAFTFSGAIDDTCVLEGLTITQSKVGIYCESFASPSITGCQIIENNNDGILLHEGCEPIISNCNIIRNGNSGIRMTHEDGTIKNFNVPIINNCLIAWNSVYGIRGGKPALSNCTVSDNGVCGVYESEAAITNSIIYFNGTGSTASQVSNAFSSITYSDIQGISSGVGNINSDPLFADRYNDDYHLMSETGRWDQVNLIWVQDVSSSPCIDAGNPVSDIGLEPAPNGSAINMGVYGGTDQASMSP